MIGLKRGTVQLCEHEEAWELEAQNTIARLKKILGAVAKDVQHVGSSSIPSIKAKPIIDIAVAVNDFNDVLAFEKELKADGFYYRPQANLGEQLLFASGSFYDGTGDLQTHFIHIVKAGGMDWINYINFRDYLNRTPSAAKEYEELKESLALQAPVDRGRENYLKGKRDFIVYTLRKALAKSYLGKTVDIKIDRPIGYIRQKENYSLTYPVNYGYIPGVISGDGEELDVYLLGVDAPVREYSARIIGIVHRHNDVEDKLVAAPEGMNFTALEMEEATRFQEQYYESEIEALFKKSCGAVLYTAINNVVHYLLIKSEDRLCGFPKGHVEKFETETETALRETWEETSVKATIEEGFRQEITYTMENGKTKSAVYFLASYANQKPAHNKGFERNDYLILPFDEAYSALTFENTKEILKTANDYLKGRMKRCDTNLFQKNE